MDRDVTGQAAVAAAAVLVQARKLLKESMPLGPNKVRMTPAEMRKRLEKMAPNMRLEAMRILGPEALYRILTGKEPTAAGLFSPREVMSGT